MCIPNKRWLAGLLGLSVLAVPSCTPPEKGDSAEWVVANQTPDTLWVTARFPLDSVKVPRTEVVARRHRLTVDSIAHERSHRQSLAHLTTHQGQWYWVRNSMGGIATWASCDTSAGHEPQITDMRGVVCYRVPPHCTQLLVTSVFSPAARDLKPPISGLQLRQGTTRRVVLPGQSIAQVFRPQPTGHEHDHSASYRYQFTFEGTK